VQLIGWEERVHDPALVRFERRERPARDHQVERPAPADQARQPLSSAVTGQEPERHLGRAEPIVAVRREAEVAGKRDL
jgi:hypothetical protein